MLLVSEKAEIDLNLTSIHDLINFFLYLRSCMTQPYVYNLDHVIIKLIETKFDEGCQS